MTGRQGQQGVRRLRVGGLLVAGVLMLGGCAAVTVTPAGGPALDAPPDWAERQPFYLMGLVGEHRIDVTAVCAGRPVLQMQAIDTAADRLLALVSLGIYTPRTARVWCRA